MAVGPAPPAMTYHSRGVRSSFSVAQWAAGGALFALLYLEPLEVGGLKVAYLWKAVVICILGVMLAVRAAALEGRVRFPSLAAKNMFVYWGLAAALVLPDFLQVAPLTVVSEFAGDLLPVIFGLWLASYPSAGRRHLRILRFAAGLVALSTLPFHAGILPELGRRFDLSHVYGYEAFGFVGMFQNPSAAALAFSLSTVITLDQVVRRKSATHFVIWAAMFLISMVSLLLTNVRTGLVTGALAVVVYLFVRYGAAALRYIVAVVLVAAATAALSVSDFQGYMLRLQGLSQYAAARGDTGLDRMSSGRTSLLTAAIEVYWEAPPVQKLFGVGRGNLPDRMYEKGLPRLTSHNMYVDELVGGGAVGLFTLLMGYYWAFRVVRGFQQARVRALYMSLLAAFLCFGLFKGADFSTHSLLLALLMGARFSTDCTPKVENPSRHNGLQANTT